jgi:hypothetical protein
MRAYCGQTRDPRVIAILAEHGVGECTVRGELLSRKRDPWFYDNGAFRDWQAGKEFNSIRFVRDMRRIRYSNGVNGAPDFVVLPDIVAAGERSLAFSSLWWHDVEGLPAYLAVQDGMTSDSVRAWLDDNTCAGLFVGGSLEWKLETAASWVALAHELGMRCHVGRVGIPERIRWAAEIGADSIDSCLPLMFQKHLDRFLATMAEVA